MTGILVNSILSHIKELAMILYSFKRCNHGCTVFSMRKASKFIKILGNEYLKFKFFSFLFFCCCCCYSNGILKLKIVIVWKYIWQTRLLTDKSLKFWIFVTLPVITHHFSLKFLSLLSGSAPYL